MTDDPAARSRRPREAGARLLLVDDDVELAALLSDYLRAEGFHVDTLADGDAIDERLDRYDVLILDVMLPGLSGIDILRRIRRRSDRRASAIATARARRSPTRLTRPRPLRLFPDTRRPEAIKRELHGICAESKREFE